MAVTASPADGRCLRICPPDAFRSMPGASGPEFYATVRITSSTDLDSWLTAIRQQLAALLKAGRRIKITSRRKEK